MAHVPPRQRESSGARPSPLALHASTLLCVLAACADLLDIPSHPQLVDEPLASPEGAPSSAPADAPPVSSPTAEPLMPSPLEAAMDPLALDTRTAATTPATASDAGVADAAATPPSAPSDAALTPECPSPQRLGPNDRCYATVATLLSWLDARRSCRALGNGWDLAAIHEEPVNQFLAALLTSETWIGASDRGTEGTWIWVDTGDTFWNGNADAGSAANGAYVNWSDGEPNDNNGSDCARIQPGAGGTWADLDCAALRSAVCEGPVP